MTWTQEQTDKPISPGEFLLEKIIKPLGIHIPDLAEMLEIPANRLYLIINGKRELSLDTAIRLGTCFETGPELWLTLQMQYDLYKAESERVVLEAKLPKYKDVSQKVTH